MGGILLALRLRLYIFALVFCVSPGFLLGVAAHAASAQPAGTLLAEGQADRALAVLQQSLRADGPDAASLNLECRVYFSEGLLAEAEPPCEQAVALAPDNGTYHLWLGRVLGRRAQHAPLLSAYGIARKVRLQFEAAWQLAPRNAAAAADLARFYSDAPGLVGGSQAKARAISAQVAPWDPELAHSILAEAAIHDKQENVAEQQLRLATTSTNAEPEDYIALASFYRKQDRVPDMLTSLDKAVALDVAHDDTLVSAAKLLTLSSQRPNEAIALLQTYLDSSHQSEDAPAFRVRAELARLLDARGNVSSAQQQMAMARALASHWQPKQKAGS